LIILIDLAGFELSSDLTFVVDNDALELQKFHVDSFGVDAETLIDPLLEGVGADEVKELFVDDELVQLVDGGEYAVDGDLELGFELVFVLVDLVLVVVVLVVVLVVVVVVVLLGGLVGVVAVFALDLLVLPVLLLDVGILGAQRCALVHDAGDHFGQFGVVLRAGRALDVAQQLLAHGDAARDADFLVLLVPLAVLLGAGLVDEGLLEVRVLDDVERQVPVVGDADVERVDLPEVDGLHFVWGLELGVDGGFDDVLDLGVDVVELAHLGDQDLEQNDVVQDLGLAGVHALGLEHGFV